MKKIASSLLLSMIIVHLFAQDIKRLSDISIEGAMAYYAGRPYSGEVVEFVGTKFDRNKLTFHGRYQNGKPNGHIKRWYSNHRLEFDENYGVDGLKDGQQIYYYDNGKPKENVSYKRGKLDGYQTQWFENGKKEFVKSYTGGVPTGKWTFYDENEKVVSEISYQNGLMIAETDYANNKKLSEKYYSNGSPNGKWLKYDENGTITSETTYGEGKIMSERLFYNGKKYSEKYYQNDLPEGKWTVHDSNEQLLDETIYDKGKLVSRRLFSNGLPDGEWISRNGLQKQITVYKNGKLSSESNYDVNDFLDGRQIEVRDSAKTYQTIYKSGKKISEGMLVDGKQDGQWLFWSDEGQKLIVKDFNSGQIVKEYEPKLIAYLISNFQPSSNSFLVKVDNIEKPFIRVNISPNARQTDRYKRRLVDAIQDKFERPEGRLSRVYADGPHLNETINFIVDVLEIDVKFEKISCVNILTNNKTYGYAATVGARVSVTSVDRKTNYIKVISSTTNTLILPQCYPTEDEAFNAALTKDFVKKFIDKEFPAKKR